MPKGIGPHEDRELPLMRRRRKNVALFHEFEPEDLDQFLAEGFNLLKFVGFKKGEEIFYNWIIFRDGYGRQALRLKEIIVSSQQGFDAAREHEIGRILSYTREEVDQFLKHTKKLKLRD